MYIVKYDGVLTPEEALSPCQLTSCERMFFSSLRFKVMTAFRVTQRIRHQMIKVLLVIMMSVSFYIFWTHRRASGNDAILGEGDVLSLEFATTQGYWNQVDRHHQYSFALSVEPSVLLVKNLTAYLPWLHHGVRIVSLPEHLSLKVIQGCRHLDKLPLMLHQHALEISFPKTLREMSKASGVHFDPLSPPPFSSSFPSSSSLSSSALINGSASALDDSDDGPVLSYVEAYPYHAVYCTKKSNNKDPRSSREDWTRRDPYWNAVAEYLLSLPSWRSNMGLDFLAPASHPQLKPFKRNPHRMNYLNRLTFLSTDMDMSGSWPKDIVVPYSTEVFSATQRGPMASEGRGRLLLYFAGGDNPKEGLRSRLDEQFKLLLSPENAGVRFNLVTGTGDKGQTDYLDEMASSQFCLIVRGDTSSSRRLFTAVALGCIPVIVSDWIQLPYERLVDYKKFVFFFPEATAFNLTLLREMVTFLRAVPQSKIAEMQAALRQAKQLLWLPQLDGANGLEETTPGTLLNPITLTLIEAFMTRVDYCSSQALRLSLPLCRKIRKRMGSLSPF